MELWSLKRVKAMKKRNIEIGQKILAILSVFLLNTNFVYSLNEDNVIKIRLSYKIILNPKDLARPKTHLSKTVTDEMIKNAVNEVNTLLASYWRGHRVELYEIKEVGSLVGLSNSPSYWFKVDFVKDENREKLKAKMEKAAKNNTSNYAWRQNAINIYINQATTGAAWKQDLIIIGASSVNNGRVLLHEIGHYFNLYHTQGIQYGLTKFGKTGEGDAIPGDDRVDDIIGDLPTWDRDKIAKYNFSVKYNKLDPEQKEMVDNVAENIMSYHFLKPTCAVSTN